MNIGTIASVHRYPVKSMMGEVLDAGRIDGKGLQGDRAFALLDPDTGKIASAKNPSKWPTLFQYKASFAKPLNGSPQLPSVRITFPDGSFATTEDDNLDQLLSSSLGKRVKFLRTAPGAGTLEEYWPDVEGLAKREVVTDETMPAGTFFDCAAIHLLTTSTLGSLRCLYPQGAFEPRRFRPNLVIETAQGKGPFPESSWMDCVLCVGSNAKLKVTGPCGRCVMTTLAQGDLPRDTGVLRTAAEHNNAHVGAYATVLQPGIVRQGDLVRFEEV